MPQRSKLPVLRHSGFTLIELIVVITILAILAATANKFIANPTQSYFDLETRAALTDNADTALRHMARQIRNALPNSVRTTTGTDSFIEFVPIETAGRYRASQGSSGSGDPLDFTLSADTFDVLGTAVEINTGDALVIYNLGDTDADVYSGTNRRNLLTTGSLSSLSFSGGQFPLSSPNRRFYVVNKPVTYACDMTTDPSNKKLLMYSNYAFQSSQPTSITTLDGLTSVRKSILAEHLSTCAFDYSAGVSERTAIVNLTIAMRDDTANVRLMHQVNIANTP